MVQLSSLFTVALLPGVLGRALIGPEPYNEEYEHHLRARQGYYFQNWSEGSSNIRCNNGNGGSFSANWNSKGGFVCGKGWRGNGARFVYFFSLSLSPPPS
jgi:endo-1,4-beta-xylanase